MLQIYPRHQKPPTHASYISKISTKLQDKIARVRSLARTHLTVDIPQFNLKLDHSESVRNLLPVALATSTSGVFAGRLTPIVLVASLGWFYPKTLHNIWDAAVSKINE